MADQTESDFVLGGFQQPTGSPSRQGDSPTSLDVDALLAALDNPKVAEALSRKLQSQKDVRIAKQEKQLSKFQEQLEKLEELTKGGMSRPAALAYMGLEDRLNELANQQSTPPERGGAGSAPVRSQEQIDADAFLKAVGIDPNDPEVTAMYRQGGVTPSSLISFVTRRRVSPLVNPAQAAPVGQGQASQESLMEQYKKEIATSLSVDQSLEIRRRYRERGLEI